MQRATAYKMKFAIAVIALPLVLVGLPACQDPARRPDVGLIYMLPGIEGGEWSMSFARNAFRDAGVVSDIRMFDWKRPLRPLSNLLDYEGNLERAREVAADIATYHAENPDGTIDIVGYSGGGGLAVMVAEALPAGFPLRNVILVQAAVSEDYDLTKALRRIDGHLINLHCDSDWFVLGVGTNVFGTMDRRNATSAGKSGFIIERAVPDPAQRRKLLQRPWDWEMLRVGHIGDHFSIITYGWNKRYVAPYLLPDGPIEAFGEAVPAEPDRDGAVPQ